jgi:hypothetical protein
MMTVVAIMAGLVPILWSTGTGSEVMQRIAVPMFAKWAVVSIGRSRRSTTAARRRSAALPVRWPDQAVILPFTMSRISRETEHSDALTSIRRMSIPLFWLIGCAFAGCATVEATVQSSTRIPPRSANTDIESSPRRESPAEPRGCIAEQSVQLVV